MTGLAASASRTARVGACGFAVVGLTALLATGCTHDGGDSATPGPGAGSAQHGQSSSDASTNTPPTVVRPPEATEPVRDKRGNPVAGVGLGVSVPFGLLDVTALAYRADAFPGANGTRVDVVTVEECAARGSARVSHRTWRLVDPQGNALGTAGGKLVKGTPTEDLPTVLGRGECQTTKLAIGVPTGSTPAAVQDGPRPLWVLPDA